MNEKPNPNYAEEKPRPPLQPQHVHIDLDSPEKPGNEPENPDQPKRVDGVTVATWQNSGYVIDNKDVTRFVADFTTDRPAILPNTEIHRQLQEAGVLGLSVEIRPIANRAPEYEARLVE